MWSSSKTISFWRWGIAGLGRRGFVFTSISMDFFSNLAEWAEDVILLIGRQVEGRLELESLETVNKYRPLISVLS